MVSKDENDYVSFNDGFVDRLIRLRDIHQDLLPNYGPQWHKHSTNTIRVEALARILYWNNLYQNIIDVPGVICEFGVRYGSTLSILTNLRSILEPFNHSRIIYGFDTFEGLKSTTSADGTLAKDGDFTVPENFEVILSEILTLLEADSPMSHVKKFELIKGDAINTVDDWLNDNPHAIISMCILDMDIYKPTKVVLEKIIPRLTKGSVIVFDELNFKDFPGETIALQEVLGTNSVRLRRTPTQTHCAWCVWGE